jgi:hypothetical protein
VNGEQQSENILTAAAARLPGGGEHERANRTGERRGLLGARLRFIRAMLWVVVYATAALFLMSMVLLDGLRWQSKIIGGILLLALAFIAASYGLQWSS